ncbi:MAG: sigma 54-dependent Fis family transcriptional regulator [Deltaproteobacteria bacterium]|nr:sigma 54-dependent Fis family transcriptional regulator [Deltaproteobacteria bacterium]
MTDETIPHGDLGVPVRSLRVEVLEGPDAGKGTTTGFESMTVGTAPQNDLVLSDETVSRFHLEIERRGDRIYVKDHGSTNGTAIGGAFLERARVLPGTVLKLGRTALRVGDGETVTMELFGGDRLDGLLGGTASMRQVMARVERAAHSNASVLILGETGSGKEVVARAIHARSPRAAGAFETVDCGSMLPTLIASELFGHEKGAFTGAERQHIGAFERANGGTLFLDEIGELPANLQTALLGALERRAFRRVGGTQTVSVDVRVVCATNRDLRSEVNADNFRQDLYYRIAVILLKLPPLRERKEDIPVLAEHFARAAGYVGPFSAILPQAAMDGLLAHHWPGNVRELRNVIEAAIVMGEAPILREGAAEARYDETMAGSEIFERLSSLPYNDARARLLEDFEGHYLRSILKRTGGNVSLASRRSNMDRSHLTRLIKKHGLNPRSLPDAAE